MLYRTNSQSRLVEEALRRYNISYTMVGGFSFYERAEIKDLLGYLRLVRNPHDSMALQRVINTPARGIGKTTLETLERLALETGAVHLGRDGRRHCEPADSHARALMALESFRQLILDAQAMMDPDFAGKLSADVAESAAETPTRTSPSAPPSQSQAEKQQVAEALEAATDFSFRRQREIRFRCSIRATSRPSPSRRPKRPFLQDAETDKAGSAQVSEETGWKLRPNPSRLEKEQRGSAFRAPGDRGDAARADPLHHRPHRLHQGARNRSLAGSVQPH